MTSTTCRPLSRSRSNIARVDGAILPPVVTVPSTSAATTFTAASLRCGAFQTGSGSAPGHSAARISSAAASTWLTQARIVTWEWSRGRNSPVSVTRTSKKELGITV